MSSHRGLPVALDKGPCQLGFAGHSSSLAGISHRLRTKAKAEGMEQAKASRDRIACSRWEAQQASAIVRQIPGRHRPLDLECNRANIALIEQSANASPANSGQPPVSSRNTLRHCQHSQAASKDHGPRPQPSAPARIRCPNGQVERTTSTHKRLLWSDTMPKAAHTHADIQRALNLPQQRLDLPEPRRSHRPPAAQAQRWAWALAEGNDRDG